jgi:hypothetical protein
LRSLENLRECASNLFLNFDTDFDKALQMCRSDIKQIFESKQFSDWKRSREAQGKMDLAICDRLDNVVRAIGNLGKVIVERQRRI